MSSVFPLVFSTVFTQFAAGLALLLCWQALAPAEKHNNQSPDTAPHTLSSRAWLFVAMGTLAGMATLMAQASAPHIPGLAPPAPYWMSLPGLLFVMGMALAFLAWQRQAWAAPLSALALWVALVAQSQTFTPVALLSLSGLLPLILFCLAALALGAAAMQLIQRKHKRPVTLLRLSLWCLLLLLVLVPCAGTSSDAIMRQVALAWMETLPHWAALMATAVALGLSYMGRGTAIIQAGLVVISVFASRYTFFVDGIHLALKLPS